MFVSDVFAWFSNVSAVSVCFSIFADMFLIMLFEC